MAIHDLREEIAKIRRRGQIPPLVETASLKARPAVSRQNPTPKEGSAQGEYRKAVPMITAQASILARGAPEFRHYQAYDSLLIHSQIGPESRQGIRQFRCLALPRMIRAASARRSPRRVVG